MRSMCAACHYGVNICTVLSFIRTLLFIHSTTRRKLLRYQSIKTLPGPCVIYIICNTPNLLPDNLYCACIHTIACIYICISIPGRKVMSTFNNFNKLRQFDRLLGKTKPADINFKFQHHSEISKYIEEYRSLKGGTEPPPPKPQSVQKMYANRIHEAIRRWA